MRQHSSWSQLPRGSRRSLLRSFGLSAAGAVAVACGGGTKEQSGTGATTSGASATDAATGTQPPKRGGILRVRGADNPATFDLHQNISVVTTGPAAPMFNGLVQMNPQKDGEIIADLATALPQQPDEITYIFTIPPDVKFHDGSTLTAEDVKANYEWMIKPPTGKLSTRQTILAPVVDKIETPDASTIRFTLKALSASFLVNQSVEYVAIGPKKILDQDGDLAKNPVGTGPFKRKSYTPGVSVELDRNPDYFRKGLPYLDGIVVHIILDDRTALENFLGGRLHMFAPTAEQLKEIQSRLGDKVTVVEAPTNSRDHVFMLTTRPPFSDIRVRQALSLGASRDEHLQVVFQGRGQPVGGYMAPSPAGKWSLPVDEIKKIPGYDKPDVDKAKALLQEAGIAPNTEVRLVQRNVSGDLGVYMTEQLRKLGLRTTPRVLDSGAAYAAADANEFDILPWGTVPALDDPDAVLGDIGYSGAVRNWSKVKDAEVDRLYQQQSRTLDEKERLKLVNEIDRRLLSQFATIVLGYNAASWAHYNTVRNKTYHMNESYTNRTYEDIWLAG